MCCEVELAVKAENVLYKEECTIKNGMRCKDRIRCKENAPQRVDWDAARNFVYLDVLTYRERFKNGSLVALVRVQWERTNLFKVLLNTIESQI